MSNSAESFPEIYTLAAVQEHTHAVCKKFDWDKLSNEKTFLLFIEEVGELAKAMRKIDKLALEKTKPVESDEALKQNLSEEFADVLSYLVDLANRYGIDLESSYKSKMEETLQRQW